MSRSEANLQLLSNINFIEYIQKHALNHKFVLFPVAGLSETKSGKSTS